MKRKIYEITYNGKTVKKYAWNTAKKEILRIIQELANSQLPTPFIVESSRVVYLLVDFVYIKDESGNHVAGVERWKSNKGSVVEFTIEKVQ